MVLKGIKICDGVSIKELLLNRQDSMKLSFQSITVPIANCKIISSIYIHQYLLFIQMKVEKYYFKHFLKVDRLLSPESFYTFMNISYNIWMNSITKTNTFSFTKGSEYPPMSQRMSRQEYG